MNPTLLQIYGPLAIQWYGVMIIIGLSVFMWAALRNPLRKENLTDQQFFDLIFGGVAIGLLGGRALHVLTEWQLYNSWVDIFKIWEGGFSVLGTIIVLSCYGPWYLYRHHIPILPVLDLVTLYAPLLQSISRIGCLLAGCCGGIETTIPWAIYSNGSYIHPTQLYSSFALLSLFLFLRFFIFKQIKYQGFILGTYFVGIGAERFIIDFWRSDRIFLSTDLLNALSIHQWIALCLSCAGIIILIIATSMRRTYGHL